MNFDRIPNWVLICFILACFLVGSQLDVVTFRVTDWRRPTDSLAYRLCAEIGGPNAWFIYDENGKLVCVNKRGQRLRSQPDA